MNYLTMQYPHVNVKTQTNLRNFSISSGYPENSDLEFPSTNPFNAFPDSVAVTSALPDTFPREKGLAQGNRNQS